MIRTLWTRLKQGHRTMKYPDGPAPRLPGRAKGRPFFDPKLCQSVCSECAKACPTHAVAEGVLDLGKCLFCGDCASVCPSKALAFTSEHAMATRRREDLLVSGNAYALAQALEEKTRLLFGRSLKLRQVSAGGCNACEADTNVLNTVGWDLGRFGVQFAASPRHADGLLVTGPVTGNMRLALLKTWEAVPSPKLVIAVGACSISGGPYIGHKEVLDGCGELVPVDLFIPGCPPHPLTILDGILRLLGRLPDSSKDSA